MGARGPLPNLRVVKDGDARGNPSKKPAKRQVRAKPGIPNPPASLDREARAEWKRVTSELDELGLVAKIDRAILTVYCEWWSRERELSRQLDAADSYFVPGRRDGELVKHPLWEMHRHAADRVVLLAEKLLATPVARLRANLPEESDGQTAEGILD